MRKFGKESAAPADKGADRDKGGNGWLRSHWCVLALGIIVIVALVLRVALSYGISADGDYALSGGSSAQYHLHVIESILAGSWSLTDMSVNYPIGGSLYIPPLMDFIGAGVASIFSGSMGTTEAASFALAVLNPIFGALACIPVYLIGKEMFDKTIGVAAALIFAFLALPISTTVFSSGTEYGLASLLLAFAFYFAVRMVKAADAEESSRKGILINAVLVGIFLMLAALTWNGFRIAVVLLVVAMVLQAVVSRIRGKDFTGITLGYVVAILIGTLVPAAYYVPAGLMDAVYSGPLLIAVVSVVLTLTFLALRSKPWVATIPALVVVFLVICVALAIGASDLFNDFIFGNSVYTGVMEDVVSSRVSMSNVAAYYGWLTMWLPICLALYETYVFFRRDHSSTKLFTVVWLYIMFFAAWTSYANAAVIGCVFGVGAGAVIVKVLREAKLRDWVANIKAAGFPGCFRKLVKPLPFASVIVVICLVIVPNVSFAVDAGTPSNSDADHYYTGNTSFTIKTGDSYPVGEIWESYEDVPKDGAIVTWLDYAYDAVAQGGFDNVVDVTGGGTVAASHMYTADGSAGAVAAMMLRLLLSNGDTDFSSCFGSNSATYATVASYIADPSLAHAEIEANPDVYGNVRSDITDENAVYLASIEALLSGMNEKELMEAYDAVCGMSGQKIGYILLDSSMLPLQYGDGSSFSTIAYFAGYSVNGYGAATEFYSYNLYSGATVYTSEIYDTLIWKAMIGPSASDAGYSSSYSYLVALAMSDGTTKAIPGYGLTGFEVAQWIVMYNPDGDATVSSDGWVRMDGWEAIEKQASEGGLINYLAGYVLLEYTGAPSGSSVLSGTVSSDGGEAVDGATVEVYQYSDVYGAYVLYSQTVTRDGSYEAIVPSGSYRVDISIGDIVVESFTSDSLTRDVTVEAAYAEGTVTVGGTVYDGESMMLHIESDVAEADIDIVDGEFTIDGVLPGTYSYILYGEDGTSLGTGTIDLYPGETVGLTVVPTTRTITVTVQDIYGDTISLDDFDEAPIVIATNTSTGAQFQAEVGEDGRAVISVISGRYTLSMGNGLVAMTSTTQNASSSNRTATITGYESESVVVQNAPGEVLTVYAGEFSTVTYERDGQTMFDIPVGLATDEVSYSIYGISGSSVYHGIYEGGGTIRLSSAAYSVVTGTVTDDGDGLESTVEIFNDGFRAVVVTDSDGNFTAYVPANQTYTIYAHTNSQVYLGSVEIGGDTELEDLDTVDGRRITATLRYDSSTSDGNVTLPFAKAIIVFTYNDVEYQLVTMTNTSGSAYFYIPDSTEATVYFNNTDGELDNDAFECTDLSTSVSSGTANATRYVTIQYVGYEEDQENTVRQIPYTAEYDMELVFYDDDENTIELSAGETVMLCPGQYDITIDGSTGAYFNGTAYLYPGQDGFVGLDVEEVVTVNVEKDDADSITIESDGSYHSFAGGYYFEVGYEYYLTSVNNSGETQKIKYGYLDLTDASGQYDIDMTATADAIEVTGHVGISASGTITVEGDGFRHEFEVSSGSYTLTLPADVGTVEATVEVSATVSSVTYYFSATGTFSDMTDGSVRNLAVISYEEEEEEEEPSLEVDITSALFQGGDATVSFTVTNNTDSDMTYLVTAGSDWSLDRACSVTVPAHGSVDATVTGYYDEALVAPGHDGVTLIVSDVNGTDTVTTTITENSAPSTGSEGMEVLLAGDDGASSDSTSPSQYRFAITLVNNDTYSKEVTFDFAVPSGWYGTIMDSAGTYVGEVGDTVTVYGKQTVTYYVALMQVSSEADETVTVPTISAAVSIDGVSQSVTLEPMSAEVQVDGATVSGGDAIDERSGVPAGIWFLLAVIILMVIAILWLASKRGVFSSRK